MHNTKTNGRAGLQAGRNTNSIGALVTLAANASNLTTLRVSNAALKSDTLPTRIKILQWGANDTTKGKFHVTPKTVEKLAENQRRLGFERVALDYNHCSIEGTPANQELLKQGRPPMIFGYGRPNALPNDGIWLEDMEWTPLGVECAKQFEDLSPAVSDEMGCVTFVHSVALTPNGCTHGLTFFSAIEGRAKPIKAIERVVAALEWEAAARATAQLSAAESGAQVSTSAGAKVNPDPMQAAMTLLPEDMAKAVYSMVVDDVVGDDVRRRLRSMVCRRVSEGWNAEQIRRPGARGLAEHTKFRDDINRGTEEAVRAYARLKLGSPTALELDIAGSRANPVNGR